MTRWPLARAKTADVQRVVAEELDRFDLRRLVVTTVARAIPFFVGNRVRTALLRTAGWRIGSGSTIFGVPRVFGSGRAAGKLDIGYQVTLNVGCTLELSERITIGDAASLGPDVCILTSSHKLGPSTRRAGEFELAPVTIGSGAWIGARAVILPGVTIGKGAIVAANSVVNKDVAANALVAGNPATVVVRRLPG